MFSKRDFPIVVVSDKSALFLQKGHVWVYGEEIIDRLGEFSNGMIVDVVSRKGTYLGSGFYNDNSKITVRILSKNANDRFDASFFERRIRYSVDYRLTVLGGEISSCRLIFGEADGFPGFTVDKFNDILVTQTLSLGIEQRKTIIFPLLVKVLKEYGIEIRAIYERNDVSVREKEGLTESKGFFELDGLETDLDGKTVIKENGILYNVDYINGQKTGFFLDQRFNRLSASKIANGKNVLDCFTHTGSFALNCAKAGAKSVTAVDISPYAIEQTEENIKLNGLSDIVRTKCANVFEYLSELNNSKQKPYDMIILDPPAFTKSGGTVESAKRGYKEINMKAMKILPRGGWLATCSCSHFMSDDLFRKMLCDAAKDANVSLLCVEARQQASDHPILFGVPETDYLKFYIFRVI